MDILDVPEDITVETLPAALIARITESKIKKIYVSLIMLVT